MPSGSVVGNNVRVQARKHYRAHQQASNKTLEPNKRLQDPIKYESQNLHKTPPTAYRPKEHHCAWSTEHVYTPEVSATKAGAGLQLSCFALAHVKNDFF